MRWILGSLGFLALLALISCQVANFQELNGVRFATLDDVAASTPEIGSQVDGLNLPTGWVIAPSDATSRAAASQFTWGTDCLVLADGSVVSSSANANCENTHLVGVGSQFRSTHKRILISKAVSSISGVVPSSGPIGGGNQVTINGVHIGSGSDITEVIVAGLPATIMSQSSTQVIVTVALSQNPITGDVVVVSRSVGRTMLTNAYSYIPSGAIQMIIPSNGPNAGGNTVTIRGTALGNGNDISTVTFGTASAAIVSQTASEVVVTVPTGTTGVVTLTVTSASSGVNTLANAYTFNAAPVITSVTPASGEPAGGYLVTISGDLSNGVDVESVTLNGVAATIRSMTSTEVIVMANPGTGSGPVVVKSTSRGSSSFNVFSYRNGGKIDSVVPNNGAVSGGSAVTISGSNLGSGSDITAVMIGAASCSISSQTANSVIVTIAPVTVAGVADVIVSSTTLGNTSLAAAYTFITVGEIKTVNPSSGPTTGNTVVTISGTDLGTGSDVTEVSVAGVIATILSQDANTVVVRTNPGQAILGNVVLKSISRGTITKTSAFTYLTAGTVRTIVPAAVAAAGGATVTIEGEDLGSGDDIVEVLLADVPATIVSQTATSVVVTVGRSGATTGTVTIKSVSRGAVVVVNAFAYTADGSAPFNSPTSGPALGGTTVTITGINNAVIGSGSDITSVTLAGVAASIVSQTTTSVVVVTGPGAAGIGAVTVTSTTVGATTMPNSWTYLTAGSITSVTPAVGPISGHNQVTITGTDMGSGSDVTEVALNGFKATITSQSATQIIVTAAPGNGSGEVTVISASRGKMSLAASYTYDPSIMVISYFTFNGNNYATLDNAAPTDQTLTGCQSNFMPVPAGWTIAPDNNETRVAVFGPRYKFGTTCLVMANGNGINSATGAACGTNMLISIGANVGAASCPARVLIIKKSDSFDTESFTTGVSAITNYVVYNGKAYATIENNAASDAVAGCTDHAVKIPAKWSIATNDADAVSIAKTYIFGTSCLATTNGASIGHGGDSCGTGQLLSYDGYYSVANCMTRILISTPLPVPLAPGVARTLKMKYLLVSTSGNSVTENQLAVAKRTCQMVGSKFDIYATTPTNTSDLGYLTGDLTNILQSSPIEGNYQGIIVSANLILQNFPDVKNKLTDYARAFHVNMVVLYTFPAAALGVTVNATAATGATPTNLRVAASFKNDSAMSGLKKDHTIPMDSIFHYPAVISDPTIAFPVLEFFNSNGTEGVAAAIYDPQDGHKEMHFFFDQAAWDLPAAVYAHVWFNWLSRGLYVGQRRIHLSPQIDDLFLSTGVWQVGKNLPDGPAVRITATDMDNLANFIDELNAGLPAGSNIKAEWGINGAGVGDGNGNVAGDALFAKAMTDLPRFWWESHGYTHLNFTQTGTPPHDTTYEETYVEQNRNYHFMLTSMFNTPERFSHFSNESMITPGIYGLHNGNALRALYDNGIHYLVGENSRLDLQPTHPYHCIHTNASFHGFDGMFVIPRYPTTVYFDCSNIAQNTAEYNFYYNATWGRGLNWEEIMKIESIRTAVNLITLRQDPYMFHQANVAGFNYADPFTGETRNFSLLSLWLRYIVGTVSQYWDLPIINFKQDDQALRCMAREAQDACDATMTLSLNSNNVVDAINVVAPLGNCKVPITGAKFASNETSVTGEQYGTDYTSTITIGANANFKLALNSTVSFL